MLADLPLKNLKDAVSCSFCLCPGWKGEHCIDDFEPLLTGRHREQLRDLWFVQVLGNDYAPRCSDIYRLKCDKVSKFILSATSFAVCFLCIRRWRISIMVNC